MGYEIKQQDWQNLPEDAQREIYNYFLFKKQNVENLSMVRNNEGNVFTLPNHITSHIDYPTNTNAEKDGL